MHASLRASLRASLLVSFVSSSLPAAELPQTRPLPPHWKAAATAKPRPAVVLTFEERTAKLRAALAIKTPAAASAVSAEEAAALSTVARTMRTRTGSRTPRVLEVGALNVNGAYARMGEAADVWTAREALRRTRPLLGVRNPDEEFAVQSVTEDQLGQTHVRFAQRYRGLEVWPAHVQVHLDRDGKASLINGAFTRTPRRVHTVASVKASEARSLAAKAMNRETARTTEPQLILYASDNRPTRLAWRLEVDSAPAEKWTVVIDAHNGEKLAGISRVYTANVRGSGIDMLGQARTLNVWQAGGSYYLIDTTKAMYDATSTPPAQNTTRGAIMIYDARNLPVSDEYFFYYVTSNIAGNWSNHSSAVSAAYSLGLVYDYYRARHNLNSFDGNGASIIGVVRHSKDMDNAFWNGQIIAFGAVDRWPASLDFVGHEMTHAVTERTAGLIYQDQSGALNEAMSDIFGEMAEFHATGTNDWILGTQMTRPLRSMAVPEQHDQPSKMSNYYVMQEDNGGVHYNSGIINRAFYLLANAIGRADAEKIFYRALTTYLLPRSDFVDARIAAVRAASDLFGASSNQTTKTGDAFDSVEVFDTAAPPAEPELPSVSGADSTLFLFADGNSALLGRRQGSDPQQGVQLVSETVAETRPSVSGDGTVAIYVSAAQDACFVSTDAINKQCVGIPGEVNSVAMSPDATRYAFVFLDAAGDPTETISVVDVVTDLVVEYDLEVATSDGDSSQFVVYADSMEFTADGDFLVYDALAVSRFNDGSQRASWAIYALDLQTGEVFPLVAPVTGADMEYPALSSRSDNFLLYDVQTPTASYVVSTNLETGDGRFFQSQQCGSKPCFIGMPVYNGDDTAMLFTAEQQDGSYSLLRWALQGDRISTSGNPTLWLAKAYFPVIYRRGVYRGPTTEPGILQLETSRVDAVEGSTVTVGVKRVNGNKGTARVNFRTANGSAIAGQDYYATNGLLEWKDGEDNVKYLEVVLLNDNAAEGTETLSLVLESATGAPIGSVAATSITIENRVAPPPGRKRPVRRG